MSERNDRMAAMLAAEAPARDFAFEIAVLQKIEQRRFVRSTARNLGVALGAALLLALLAPQLGWVAVVAGRWDSILSRLTGNSMVMVALLVAAFAAWRLRPGAEA